MGKGKEVWEEMGKGKTLLSRRGGQRKSLLGMEEREVGVRKWRMTRTVPLF
jgi:hypothetical protein